MNKKTQTSSTYNPAIASLLIRVGLAAVFAYAAIDAFREPNAWISFVPEFTTKFVNAKVSLDAISVMQLGLAAWLVWGKFIEYAVALSVALLGGILIFNGSTFLVTFRDIGLITASIALIFLEEK
jgi:hypothetical protein